MQKPKILAASFLVENPLPPTFHGTQVVHFCGLNDILALKRSTKGGMNIFLRGNDWDHHFRTSTTHRNLNLAQKVNMRVVHCVTKFGKKPKNTENELKWGLKFFSNAPH